MAEHLFRQLVGGRGLGFTTSSVGTSFDGRPPTDEATKVMAQAGIDISEHRSRMLRPEIVEEADLIIGMEPVHVRDVAACAPGVLTRSFTFKGLIRTAEEAGGGAPTGSLADWAMQLSAGRDTAQLLGVRPDDTVADPFGQSLRAYRRCLDEITDLVHRLGDLLGDVAPDARADTA